MRFEENRDFEYAKLFLLDNPYSIDTTYDYFIPHSMRGEGELCIRYRRRHRHHHHRGDVCWFRLW